ncbi:uncharacterized protein LOC112271904 [Brachypodium distachyon]|uniref:uncharacterized protein LOC112271904 n=1 Tax=Brachypodium distachyon TaxID=15368 RepID=UPI000D0DC001|nr:uncharacterized protein LOC112271904 [Brachypodium distachyon]|eukprot:XP_024317907.1 uncharacterized protein LOC112271904 [Brachypodium distachyon]
MVGPYNSVEHRAYVNTISEGGCHNVVAACFDDMVAVRPDPKFGKLVKAGERYSRLATPSMIAVGSHLRDTCGKVKPQVVLGLGVPVAPMPKIPRPPSSRKRKAPSPDLADVAESRSALRESMNMHLARKIDIEKILPPLRHERVVFTQSTRLQLVVDTSSKASGAGVPVFSLTRGPVEEELPGTGTGPVAPVAPEAEPPIPEEGEALPRTQGGVRDLLEALELVRGLVEAVGTLPALKAQVGVLSAALDAETSKATLALSELASERARRGAVETELCWVSTELTAMEARARLAEEGQKDAIAKTRRAEEDLVVVSLNV